ncbi:MAG: hypothetical protein HQL95_03690 [Magnetococcales bacterium]|nr:hypothetical protein [Magnetococcales bacterium]
MIALQGSWGRGKTDVLARVAQMTWPADWRTNQEVKTLSPQTNLALGALWLNPWMYRGMDLHFPLIQMLEGITKTIEEKHTDQNTTPSSSRNSADHTKSLMADIKHKEILYKTYKIIKLFLSGNDSIDDIIEAVLGALFRKIEVNFSDIKKEQDPLYSGIPTEPRTLKEESLTIDMLPGLFSKLVENYLKAKLGGHYTDDARLLICIDDMDRCLPEKITQLLESIHFLTATNVQAIFLLAIDPSMAEKAIKVHLQALKDNDFDTKRFLDKLITYRVAMPPVTWGTLGTFLRQKLAETAPTLTPGTNPANISIEGRIRELFNPRQESVFNHFLRALTVQETRNPRVLEKIFSRIEILLIKIAHEQNIPATVFQNTNLNLFVRWLALSERWPEVRFALQDVALPITDVTWDDLQKRTNEYAPFKDRFSEIILRYVENKTGYNSLVAQLPKPEDNPDLVQFFREEGSSTSVTTQSRAIAYHGFELILQKLGV